MHGCSCLVRHSAAAYSSNTFANLSRSFIARIFCSHGQCILVRVCHCHHCRGRPHQHRVGGVHETPQHRPRCQSVDRPSCFDLSYSIRCLTHATDRTDVRIGCCAASLRVSMCVVWLFFRMCRMLCIRVGPCVLRCRRFHVDRPRRGDRRRTRL